MSASSFANHNKAIIIMHIVYSRSTSAGWSLIHIWYVPRKNSDTSIFLTTADKISSKLEFHEIAKKIFHILTWVDGLNLNIVCLGKRKISIFHSFLRDRKSASRNKKIQLWLCLTLINYQQESGTFKDHRSMYLLVLISIGIFRPRGGYPLNALPPASSDQQQNEASLYAMSVFIQSHVLTFIHCITYIFVPFM